MTSQRVRIVCPSCGHALRIRVQNLGRRGTCRFCGHKFRAHVHDAEILMQRIGTTVGAKERGAGKLEVRIGLLESELQGVLSHLSNQSAQHASVVRELEQTRVQLALVQDVLDHAREQYRQAVPADGHGSDHGSQHERARSEISALRDRALDANRLEIELGAERARSGLLRAQLLEIQSHGGVLAYHEDGPSQAELERPFAPDGEAARNDGGEDPIVGSLGPSVEFTPEPEDLDRTDRSAGDWLAEDPFEAERFALTQELDRLRNRLNDLEPAFEAARTQLEWDRASWEAERREIEVRWERRHRAALAEAEIREADYRRALDDRHQADGDRAGECRRLTAQCDALKRVVRRLRARLVARERSRSELELALAQARERWDAERLEWQTQAEQDRQESIRAALAEASSRHHDEFQRRLAEQQAAIEQERQAAREANEARESLQGELEAARSQLVDAREELKRQAEAASLEREALAARLELAETQTHRQEQQAETLRAETEDLRRGREHADAEHARALVALRAEWEDERRQATENAERLRREIEDARRDGWKNRTDEDSSGGGDSAAEPQPQPTTLRNALARLARSIVDEGTDLAIRPRPRSESFADPEEYRADLARWLTEAQQRQQQASAQNDQLESELTAARTELELLSRDLALGTWDLDDADEDGAEVVFPFERD